MRELDEQIGRLLVVGIPGKSLDDATRQALEELRVGGVILFRRNIGGPDEVEALTAALHALPSQPLVSIDQEGGRVTRLGEPFTQMPAAASVGNTTDAELAYQIGFAMAEELAAVGIDADFAPVLDVNSNPENPIIGDRAYSSSPQMVAEMGIAVMCGLIAGGVVPCGKHFPGHGDTTVDSHVDLPVVRRSREDLERTELAPFRAAIAAGVPMLMTAHVLYPALDSVWPATLSRAVVTGVRSPASRTLRRRPSVPSAPVSTGSSCARTWPTRCECATPLPLPVRTGRSAPIFWRWPGSGWNG
jgi:beta-N-acetylhexosaminidase